MRARSQKLPTQIKKPKMGMLSLFQRLPQSYESKEIDLKGVLSGYPNLSRSLSELVVVSQNTLEQN